MSRTLALFSYSHLAIDSRYLQVPVHVHSPRRARRSGEKKKCNKLGLMRTVINLGQKSISYLRNHNARSCIMTIRAPDPDSSNKPWCDYFELRVVRGGNNLILDLTNPFLREPVRQPSCLNHVLCTVSIRTSGNQRPTEFDPPTATNRNVGLLACDSVLQIPSSLERATREGCTVLCRMLH